MRERFEIDPAHTVIGFSAKHLAVATVRGHFGEFSGWFEADPDDVSHVQGEVTVEAESLTTGVDQRDSHLRSADFFEAPSHPNLVYRPTRGRKVADGAYEVEGELTIKNTTRPITLQVTVEGETVNPFGEGRRIGVTATGEVNRMEYGLNWNGLAGAIPMAGHSIKLLIDAELVATPVAAAVSS